MRSTSFAATLLVLLTASACEGGPGSEGGCERAGAPRCVAAPLSTGARLTVSGSTRDEVSHFGSASCTGGGRDAPDAAFQWTAPRAGRYAITTEGSDFDTVLTVREGCEGAEIACNDDAGGGSLQSAVSVELAACQTVLIVVDGFSATSVGEFAISISRRESLCDDGTDDDDDGLVDCEDPDCLSTECLNGGQEWPAEWAAFEDEVLRLTNERRAAGATCGAFEVDPERTFPPAPALEMNAKIQLAARGHSLDMGQRDYFEHDTIDDPPRTLGDRLRAAGFEGAAPWGENIAAGSATPADVVRGWMESPGHCRNLMNSEYRTMGAGYAQVEPSTWGHYWTQDFAAGP